MNITTDITAALDAAFAKHVAAAAPASLRISTRDGSDYQCNDAMAVAAKAGLNARELAVAVAADLSSMTIFDDVTVTGPGFVNLRLSEEHLLNTAKQMLSSGNLGVADLGSSVKTVIDFGGPNIAKPLHVGHLRSFVIGESLRRILSETNHSVVSDIHLGDWGLQMGMLLMEIWRVWPDAGQGSSPMPPITVDELENIYREASAACKADAEALNLARNLTARLQSGDPAALAVWRYLRDISLSAIAVEVASLDAHFDCFFGESDTSDKLEPMIADLKARGTARESDGAIVIDVSPVDAADGCPPLLLQKSDGAALYGATDLATLRSRILETEARKIVYCVDQRQSQHLESVFTASRMAGYDCGAELVHAGFGTVNSTDGKPFKTRDGGTARLSDLISTAVTKAHERLIEGGYAGNDVDAVANIVGVGALKFADLTNDRLTGYIFDVDRMVSFEGRTGPYLQYACVRIAAVVDKAKTQQMEITAALEMTHPAERALLLECLRFPLSVADASKKLQPREIAERAFLVGQAFSRFYSECPVVKNGNHNPARLALCVVADKVLRRCLYLLGMGIPARM